MGYSLGAKALGEACRTGTLGEGMPLDQIEACKVALTALLRRAARGAVLASIVICAGTAMARAGDDTMSSSTPFYDKFLQVIGIEGGPDIQYSERSPLVVPPTRDLPPPAADAPPPVPDWPKDPDIQKRAKAKAKEKPKPHPDYVLNSSRPLRPGELDVPGANTNASNTAIPGGNTNADYPERDYQPPKKNLFSFDLFKRNKPEYATFTGEPSRTSLTDPPPGYLTPSPDQPYGVGPENKKYKVPTVADRATPVGGTADGN